MSRSRYITRAYQGAHRIDIDENARIVFMSDCHRGYGDWADDFARNQNNFFAALEFYYRRGYTYIELGDGDELWENRQFSEISTVYNHIFWLLSRFYRENRFYQIYGNHDRVKEKDAHLQAHYYDASERRSLDLFPGITAHEGIVLRRRGSGQEIFLLHGHQGDFLNDQLWRLARFLVRHLWRPLNARGIQDPTSAAVNHTVKAAVEKELCAWSDENEKILIAGHTHRAVFPEPGACRYFNDGSCVHPRCITAIELTGDSLSLVKWGQRTRADGTLYIGREILAGPRRIEAYYPAAEPAEGTKAAR